MKKLKLFPKFFLYTFGVMLLVVIITHWLIYVLAPKMQFEVGTTENVKENITVSVNQQKFVTEAVKKALPISLSCSLLISVVCSLLLSKRIVSPIQKISDATEKMMKLDKSASCLIYSKDEIGLLSKNVNNLYFNLLSTIKNLEKEKEKVSELEQSKVDFLRSASHELKTPVTALNIILENMILGIGKYQDYNTYLPECKEIVEQISTMIHDILETSKINISINEEYTEINLVNLMFELCEPYKLIASANKKVLSLNLPKTYYAKLPKKEFNKAISNILANAVSYTEIGKNILIYIEENNLVIENECTPISENEIPHLFEPFYRTDFSRSRESGGNGLGLYIVHTIFSTYNIHYTLTPMEENRGMRFTIKLC